MDEEIQGVISRLREVEQVVCRTSRLSGKSTLATVGHHPVP